MSMSKILYPLLNTGSNQDDLSHMTENILIGDVKNQTVNIKLYNVNCSMANTIFFDLC